MQQRRYALGSMVIVAVYVAGVWLNLHAIRNVDWGD